MINGLILLSMCLFALLAIQTRLLRNAIIHLAVLSLLAAFLYMRLAAPELAIAEAVIGSGLVTLLYLAALKRNRVYTIGVVGDGQSRCLADPYMHHITKTRAMREIHQFFLIREYELQVVFVPESLQEALGNDAYDLVMQESESGMIAYTDDESYIMLELEMLIQMRGAQSGIRFERYRQNLPDMQLIDTAGI